MFRRLRVNILWKAPTNQCEKIKLCYLELGPVEELSKLHGLTIYRTNIRMAYKMQEWSASSSD